MVAVMRCIALGRSAPGPSVRHDSVRHATRRLTALNSICAVQMVGISSERFWRLSDGLYASCDRGPVLMLRSRAYWLQLSTPVPRGCEAVGRCRSNVSVGDASARSGFGGISPYGMWLVPIAALTRIGFKSVPPYPVISD